MRVAMWLLRGMAATSMVFAAACAADEAPDNELRLPVLLTKDLPFGYPPDLYARRVDGDVALFLFVDSLGLVVPESTRISEPSIHPAFDSTALVGARYLSFQPAERAGRRLGHAIILPVQFRYPRDSVAPDTTTGSR